MDRQGHGHAFRHRVLFLTLPSASSFGRKGERAGRTTVTSSPTTVTSGLLKCRRAVMAAIDAQSSMFPSSSRKWTSTRMDQTCAPDSSASKGERGEEEGDEPFGRRRYRALHGRRRCSAAGLFPVAASSGLRLHSPCAQRTRQSTPLANSPARAGSASKAEPARAVPASRRERPARARTHRPASYAALAIGLISVTRLTNPS